MAKETPSQDGLYGDGMDKNVLDAYKFLVDNYVEGDELYFFGFSRGAYTVRSLVGLVNNAGLLKKEHSSKVSNAYALYRSKDALDHPHGSNAEKFRRDFSQEVSIQFLGVFDTVGALGIPLTLFDKYNAKKYSFHDTSLSRSVKNAYHAVAIDERRYDFYPTLWHAKEGTKSEQRWFPGVHSDVGGGYGDAHGLSDLALQWMLTKAGESGLNYKFTNDASFAPDALAPLHNSYTSMMQLMGEHARHVCDSTILNERSVAIPHEFSSAHSWYRGMKDKRLAQATIPWWNVVGRMQAWFDKRSSCDMTDVTIDDSVFRRIKAHADYRPHNIMPIVLPVITATAPQAAAPSAASENDPHDEPALHTSSLS